MMIKMIQISSFTINISITLHFTWVQEITVHAKKLCLPFLQLFGDSAMLMYKYTQTWKTMMKDSATHVWACVKKKTVFM